MVELTAANAALGGAKTIYEMLKGLLALSTDAKVKAATIELMEVVLTTQQNAFEANQTQTALLQQIGDQKAEIDRLVAWDRDKERYQMKRFTPGSIAYCLKPEMAAGEPAHCLCAGCYQNHKKGFLQATSERTPRGRVHVCSSCGKETVMGPEEPPATSGNPPQDTGGGPNVGLIRS